MLIAGYALAAAVTFIAMRSFTPIRVAGQSMHPALHAGDLVFVRDRAPALGEVALLAPQGRGLVLHRVVDERGDGAVVTRGDANEIADATPTPAQHVRGTVVAVVPVGALIERWRARSACDTLSAQPNSTRR